MCMYVRVGVYVHVCLCVWDGDGCQQGNEVVRKDSRYNEPRRKIENSPLYREFLISKNLANSFLAKY